MASSRQDGYVEKARPQQFVNRTYADASLDDLLLNNWRDKFAVQIPKKDNPEREREAAVSRDSPSMSNLRPHVPHTYPRTKPASTGSQKALQQLRHTLDFNDETSSADGDDARTTGASGSLRNRGQTLRGVMPPLRTPLAQGGGLSLDSEAVMNGSTDDSLVDSNQIVGRLMQIRDYLKQASSMKESLNKDSPSSREQLSKLSTLIVHLKDQEAGYLALLQKMLADRNGTTGNDSMMAGAQGAAPIRHRNPAVKMDADDNISELSVDLDNVSQASECTTSEKEAEVKALRQQRDLLRKMLEQQRMLKTLHERQAQLLELQKKAESGLVGRAGSTACDSHQQQHNGLSDEEEDEHNQANEQDDDKDNDDAEETESERSSSTSDEDSESSMPGPDETEEHIPPELQALRQRLATLQSMFDDKMADQAQEMRTLQLLRDAAAESDTAAEGDNGGVADDSSRVENDSDCSSPEKRELQSKLTRLQEKKSRMEQLLGELQALRDTRKHSGKPSKAAASFLSDVSSVTSESTPGGKALREAWEQTQSASSTAGQAETVLDVMEQESKLRKLQEVRGRLNQLRDLVQYYQAGNDFIHGGETDSEPATPINSDMSLMGNLSAYINAPAESTEASDLDSNFSLGEFRNDPEIQDKVRKLDAARQKLAHLQNLVEMVQQWPESAEVMPGELADIAASTADESEPEDSVRSKVSQATSASGSQSFADYYERSRQRVSAAPASGDADRASQADSQVEAEAFYQLKMSEQQDELQRLMEEKEKLIRIQQELMQLHAIPPQPKSLESQSRSRDATPRASDAKLHGSISKVEATDGVDKTVKHASGNPQLIKSKMDGKNHLLVKDKQTRSNVTFQALPVVKDTDPANDQLWKTMRERRIEREAHKNGISGEEDQLTADVTTMATWGDSETSTSEEETTSENTPNEQEIEDEEDGYPSDGILQVEEEEEAKNSDNDTYTVENEYEMRQRYPAKLRKFPSGADSRKVPAAARPARRLHTHKYCAPRNMAAAGDYMWPYGVQGYPPAQFFPPYASDRAASAELIACMKEQLDTTTEMCRKLMKGQRRRSRRNDIRDQPWKESRLLYSVNQLQSQMTDVQAALQVTVDQVYNITQHINNHQEADASNGVTNQPIPTTGGTQLSFGFPGWARPNAAKGQLQTSAIDQTQREKTTCVKTLHCGDLPSHVNSREDMSRGDMSRPLLGGKKDDHVVKDAQKPGVKTSVSLPQGATGVQNVSVPPLDLDKLIKRREALSSSQRSYPSPTLSAIAAGRVVVPDSTMYRPGISAGICGTAYADTASMSSALSSGRDEKQGEHNSSTSGTPQRDLVRKGCMARGEATDSTSEFSLFEALRETIYSEVATLISQNENRPHFLIELFRELQMLSSDYLRQRALYSIQELVTKFLTEGTASLFNDEDDDSIKAPQPAWMIYQASNSEQTPSESCNTTDDDDLKVVERKHQTTPSGTTRKSASGIKVQTQLNSDLVDYAEPVETTSSLSTPASVGTWDDPFNQESLGDTVIHLDKAMQKVREYDLKMNQQANGSAVKAVRSDPNSSSANDAASENESTDNPQMSRIDTQELDRQIKAIMTEIIPVLREHMDNVCSSQLLSYLQGRVIELASLKPGATSAHEFAQFFHQQLANILRDSLAKFEGRRMRDCGEEILVDISEILFNELAFFRLMQDLDDPEVKGRLAQTKWNPYKQLISTGTDQETDGEESVSQVSEQNEDQEERQQVEEDSLGKDRDDAFAKEVNTADIHLQLLPSETKPMNRIGSDEDCSDEDDSSDFSSHTDDDTAVSRQAAQEGEDEEFSQVDQNEVMGNAAETTNEEITVDDLPAKLSVDSAAFKAQVAAEQAELADIYQGIEITYELVGDSDILPEPDGDDGATRDSPDESSRTTAMQLAQREDNSTAV